VPFKLNAAVVAVLQVSVVQALPSPQAASDVQQSGIAVFVHTLFRHTSSVQAFPSAQSAFVMQQFATAECWQRLSTQVSLVHAFPSEQSVSVTQQFGDGARTHCPGVPKFTRAVVIHVGPLVSVPFSAGVVESAALVPVPHTLDGPARDLVAGAVPLPDGLLLVLDLDRTLERAFTDADAISHTGRPPRPAGGTK